MIEHKYSQNNIMKNDLYLEIILEGTCFFISHFIYERKENGRNKVTGPSLHNYTVAELN